MTTALLEPVIHITAASKDDPEFQEKYDPNRNIILTIPDGTTTIDWAAFWMCTGLTELHLPESLTTIGYEAFWGCTGLTEVHFPESLTDIEKYAFAGCTGLTDVYCPSTKLGMIMLTPVLLLDIANIHCPAVARFMTGDSFEMELIVRRNLGPAEFRADLKAQVRSALEERGLLEGQDFDIPDYFTRDKVVAGEVDFKQELIVIWL